MRKSILLGLTLIAGISSTAQAEPWKHYTDATLGWSIAYPANWIVNPNYVSVSLGPDHEIKGVSFAIPRSVQRGTNLSHNDTTISVESVPGSDCAPSRFVDPAENLHKLHKDGRTYWVAVTSDGGAGNFYDDLVFVVQGTSPCIAVRYFIHSTNIGAYDPGTVKEFDRGKLIALFDTIRATLKLGK